MNTSSDASAAGQAGPPSDDPAAGRTGHAVADVAIRVIGGAVAVWFGAFSAVLEAFAVPLRIGTVRVPVAVLFAAAANVGMILFARWVTGNRFVALLPGLAWFTVVMAFGSRTTEGDMVLIGNDWVALALLLVGSASLAAGGYFAVMGPVARPPAGQQDRATASRPGRSRPRRGPATRRISADGQS